MKPGSTGCQSGTVFIVDDDEPVRHAMKLLLRSVGLDAETYASGDDFLERFDRERPGCLVLDIRMPGIGGLELQERLNALGSSMPIIFITAHGDVPMAVEAMQKGAFDFLQKPFRDQQLLEKINGALSLDRHDRIEKTRGADVVARRKLLTNREREVMALVVKGKPNKAIAFELGVSQRTVEIHRARVMKKMRAHSLAELVRMNV
ncbi:MAG TPA: response regulator transcription factor [Woeseiaceae bacterium]|nr:response regulator transcription factor [Woeseiaceae bacterium]